jgi:hypothetical protein
MRFGNFISDPSLWGIHSGGCFTVSFTRTRIIPTGGLSYLDFMAPGILAQSVLFVAIFYDKLTGGVSAFGLGADFTILLVAVTIMVMIGGKLYPRVAT